MKKLLQSSLAVLAITIGFAFSNPTTIGLEVTYGVSNSDPSQVKLELNDDFTFVYQDLSNVKNQIKVEGTYVLKNNTVILQSDESATKFHSKWKISEDGTAARSRKGLSFYTLRKL